MSTTTLQALHRAKAILDEVTHNMLNFGYYMPPQYPDVWGEEWKDVLFPEYALRNMARALARENKRPFVRVHDLYNWHHVGAGKGDIGYQKAYVRRLVGLQIMMPKRKYLMPLVHPLTLAGVREGPHRTLHHYIIDDPEFAKEYLKMFATREEFRAALRLPPLVTEPPALKVAA